MQKQNQTSLKQFIRIALFGVMVIIGLFDFGKYSQAVSAPIYVQFRSIISSAQENVSIVPVQLTFIGSNSKSVYHDKMDVYYQIYGTASSLDYSFNGQANIGSGVIHIPAGSGDYTVNLRQTNDSLVENDEQIVIKISSVVSRNLSIFATPVRVGTNNVFTHTIINDDLPTSLDITNVNDNSTASRIYSPDLTFVQLGKWNFFASNNNVILSKLTLQSINPNGGAVLTNLASFSSLALYDDSNFLGLGSFTNGDLVFRNFSSVIQANSSKVYTLRGYINASGTMTRNTPVAFAIKSDSSADILATASTGALLGVADINYDSVSNVGLAESRFARSTVYIFHDAYPAVSAMSLGESLSWDVQAKIFKFRVANVGTVDLRIYEIIPSFDISGLVFGSISDFRLYEDDGVGGLGTYFGQNNITVQANTANSVSTLFDYSNDQNNSFETLTIAPGTTKTFIITANTANMMAGKSTGSIRVSSKIVGSTGWNGTAWNVGNIRYGYTPTDWFPQGVFSASDSYDVDGGDLVYTL